MTVASTQQYPARLLQHGFQINLIAVMVRLRFPTRWEAPRVPCRLDWLRQPTQVPASKCQLVVSGPMFPLAPPSPFHPPLSFQVLFSHALPYFCYKRYVDNLDGRASRAIREEGSLPPP